MILKNIIATFLTYALLSSYSSLIAAQTEGGVQSWNKYNLEGELSRFYTVFFDHGADKLYVGGVNKLYQFDPRNVSVPENMITWMPKAATLRLCGNFQSDRILCQNTIRVLSSINSTHLYVCGTMALKPVCIYVLKSDFSVVNKRRPELGRWKTPSNPYTSAVSVFANQTLFTAARGTNHKNDPIISRALNGVTLRTHANDKYWLNDPHFVGGYHVEYPSSLQDKVMFFFREKAEEFKPFNYGMSNNPNDRNVVSRVATVCVNDHGGSAYASNRRFATYVKKTIVCDVPGNPHSEETTFRYTNLVSTFEIPDRDTSGESVVYGIFTMPNDAISGSAVCAYKMNDIKREMGINNYWRENAADGQLNVSYTGDLQTGPGMCVEETRWLKQTRLTFSRNHPIKFGSIFRSHQTPFYQEPGTRFTHIVVDKVRTDKSSIGENVTVLYMMSTNGLLKRVVFSDNSQSKVNWTLPDIHLVTLRPKEKVLNMVIGSKHLYVVTNLTIVQMPLAACNQYSSCSQCKESRDPYCIADESGMCASVFSKSEEQIRHLRALDVYCPSSQVVAPRDQENDVIVSLRSNLSRLMEQNVENERRISDLQSEKTGLSQQITTCTSSSEMYQSQNSELRTNVSSIQEQLTESQRAHNLTKAQFRHCVNTRKFFMNHAVRMAVNLRSRPTQAQYQREIRHLTEGRNTAMRELQACKGTKQKVLNKATGCARNLKTALKARNDAFATCDLELRTQQALLNSTMEDMEARHAELRQSNSAMNKTIGKDRKQLQTCLKRFRNLSSQSIAWRKKGRENKSQMLKMKQDRKKLVSMFKKFKSRHQCPDGRKWIFVNATGNLYTVVDQRATFDEAVASCRSMDAIVAKFETIGEIRVFTDVVQSVSSASNHWVELALMGRPSPYRVIDRTTVHRTLNGRTTFCAIFNGTLRWVKSSCSDQRKYICQKVIRPGETIARIPSVSGHV